MVLGAGPKLWDRHSPNKKPDHFRNRNKALRPFLVLHCLTKMKGLTQFAYFVPDDTLVVANCKFVVIK